MPKNRMIDTKFWDDLYVINLDPIEKLLFLYFLTNPLTSICGIYEISLRRMAFDTGIDKEMILKILARFENDNKILYRDGWIAIKNFIKNQKQSDNKDDKLNVGIKKSLEKAPENLKNWIFLNLNSNININLNTKGPFQGPCKALLKEQTNKEIEEIYNIYPTRDFIKKYSTGRCQRNREQIKELLKKYKKEQIINIINNYINECKKNKTWIKTFSNFLEEFPEPDPEYDVKNMPVEEIEKLLNEGKL